MTSIPFLLRHYRQLHLSGTYLTKGMARLVNQNIMLIMPTPPRNNQNFWREHSVLHWALALVHGEGVRGVDPPFLHHPPK